MLLPKQDDIRKELDQKIPKLNIDNDNKEYILETIWNSAIYANKSELSRLLFLYYLMT